MKTLPQHCEEIFTLIFTASAAQEQHQPELMVNVRHAPETLRNMYPKIKSTKKIQINVA